MRILVTGTAGFIGNALAIRLLERGDEVLAEWLVESVADGEAQIIEALKGLVEHDEEGPAA